MQPFIYTKRNQIHIIDLKETIRGLLRASNFLTNIAGDGEEVLFVGTKRQARSAVETEGRRCGMHIVTERWIGGTLTNFHVIRSRIKRLVELEQMELDGSINQYSKKMISTMKREERKIKRNLDGIRRMEKLPGAVVIIDPGHEVNAVREAFKKEIPIIALIDTDGNPQMVDIPIPGNDDAIRSIQIVLSIMADAVLKGREIRLEREAEARKIAEQEAARRRSEEAVRKAKAEAARKAAEEAEAARKAQAAATPAPAPAEAPAAGSPDGPSAEGPSPKQGA
jgi:small subunit ribosomal protein S2